MSLKDRASQEPAKKLWPCGVRDWLDSLDADERESGYQIVNDSGWTRKEVLNAFRGEGFPRGIEVIRKHQERLCSCP